MGKVIVGAFLILLGLGAILDQTSLRSIGLNSGTVWSLFWVVVGVVFLQKRKLFIGLIFTIIGALGFLSGFFHINVGEWIFPIIVIALGIRILIKDDSKGRTGGEVIGTTIKGSTDEDYINESVLFGSLEKKYTSQNFKGGKIDCIFGGIKISLEDIKVAKEGAKLEVNAIFGGGDIWVSRKDIVVSNGTGVFGGWNNNYSAGSDKTSPALNITGTAVFGGIEVKN